MRALVVAPPWAQGVFLITDQMAEFSTNLTRSCILLDFHIHIDPISMGMPIVFSVSFDSLCPSQIFLVMSRHGDRSFWVEPVLSQD